MSTYRVSASARIFTAKSGKEYANIKIKCGDRSINFDPDCWLDLREEIEAAYTEAISMKMDLITKRTIEHGRQDRR